jgi:glycosyltransferase involved in cell wall biosynthesis
MGVKASRKRILWVTLHFPPRQSGGVFRPIKIYKHLDKNKLEIDFLTLSLWGQYKRAVRDDSALEEVFPKPAIYRVPSIEFHDGVRLIIDGIRKRSQRSKPQNGNPSTPVGANFKSGSVKEILKSVFGVIMAFVYFPDKYVVWGWFSTLKGLWLHLRRRYDLVYTTSPPSSGHLPGLLLRSFGAKWVVDYRDGGSLWTKKAWGSFTGKVREKIDFYYQKYVLNKADYVIIQSELLKDQFVREFSIDHSRIRTIPSGFDEEYFARPSTEAPPFVKKPDELHILHVGAWYVSAEETVKIIEELNSLQSGLTVKGVNLILHAVGNDLFSEQQKNDALHIRYLYHGVVPHSALLPYFLAADCYLLSTSVGKSVDGARGFLAGKLWEYLRGGKPIIVFGSKDEAWEIIEESGVGVYLGDLNSEDHISVDALLRRVEETRTLQPKVSQHSWEARARAMQEVFLQVSA